VFIKNTDYSALAIHKAKAVRKTKYCAGADATKFDFENGFKLDSPYVLIFTEPDYVEDWEDGEFFGVLFNDLRIEADAKALGLKTAEGVEQYRFIFLYHLTDSLTAQGYPCLDFLEVGREESIKEIMENHSSCTLIKGDDDDE
jgi:hypothetical protein